MINAFDIEIYAYFRDGLSNISLVWFLISMLE
jgi:hypothetical protein